MGILDDAIREHLELKRQHGAASSELQQLEQEAFGPAARPGDPEFETGEEPAPAAELPVADDAGAAEWMAAGEEPTTVSPQASTQAAEPESVEQPIPEAPEGAIFDVEGAELGDVDLEEEFKTPAERAREEHADLDDTVDHPAPEVESLSEELENAAPAPSAPDSAEMDVPHVSPTSPSPATPRSRPRPRSPSRSSSTSFPVRPSRPPPTKATRISSRRPPTSSRMRPTGKISGSSKANPKTSISTDGRGGRCSASSSAYGRRPLRLLRP
jgi:hypothetical protein